MKTHKVWDRSLQPPWTEGDQKVRDLTFLWHILGANFRGKNGYIFANICGIAAKFGVDMENWLSSLVLEAQQSPYYNSHFLQD